MRIRFAVLLTLVTAAVLGPAAGGAATLLPPGSSYIWAQPGTAPVSTPFAQPPAWIPLAAPTSGAVPGVVDLAYAWAQPGTAPVNLPFAQPPASVPLTSVTG